MKNGSKIESNFPVGWRPPTPPDELTNDPTSPKRFRKRCLGANKTLIKVRFMRAEISLELKCVSACECERERVCVREREREREGVKV